MVSGAMQSSTTEPMAVLDWFRSQEEIEISFAQSRLHGLPL